jgi:hypothetical protein
MTYHKNFRGYNYEDTKDKVWTDEDDRKLMHFHKKVPNSGDDCDNCRWFEERLKIN